MPPDLALVGRHAELDRLDRALSATTRGDLRLLLIEGEPGIGKSRLLVELARKAEALGLPTYRSKAEELERERPFGTLAQALGLLPTSSDPDREAIGQRLLGGSEGEPAASFSPTPGLRFRLIEDLIGVLERDLALGPVCLLLDDLQWADDATLQALHEMVRRLSDEPLLIAVACRPVPRVRQLEQLVDVARPGTVDHMVLGPLDTSSVELLAAQLARKPPGETLLQHAQGAAGNPFFVRELVTALVDDELVEMRGGKAEVRGSGLPPTLRMTIVRRLAFLPDRTLRVLRWASVLGTSFVLVDLAAVAEASIDETVEALEPALRAHVLVDQGSRLAFRHDLVHEAIYNDLPEAIRVGLHLQAGRVLAAARGDPLQVAPHFARGAQGHELEAAGWIKRAADDVALRSPATAVGLLERALELTSRQDALRSELLLDLVKSLLWAGRWDDAEDLARQVLEADEGATISGTLRYVMARALVYRGRTEESIREVERAMAHGLPNRDRARLLADLSMRRPLTGDLPGGVQAAEEALRLSTADPLAASTARSGLALIAMLSGKPSDAVTSAERALPHGDGSVAETVEFVQPYFFYSIALIDADKLDDAEVVLLRLRRRTEAFGMTWALGLCEVLLGWLHFLSGRWSDAVAEAETGLEICHETGTRVWQLIVYSVLLRIATHRGEMSRAAQLLSAGERLISESGRSHMGLERWQTATALFHEASGDRARALEGLLANWQTASGDGVWVAAREIGPELVRLAVLLDRRPLVTAIPGVLEALSAGAGTPGYVGAAYRSRGLMDGKPALLLRAADAYRQAWRPSEEAAACEDAGLIHVMQSAAPAATAALERALAGYTELGATRDVARVEQSLRLLGVRKGARGTRRRPTTGWASLTPTESDVARLAAEGLTNRQIGEQMFISSRTVGTHLSHVFGKVGLSSRVGLAAAMAVRGEVAQPRAHVSRAIAQN